MNEAARTRYAARQAVADVAPEELHDRIVDILAKGAMTPGALTLSCHTAADIGLSQEDAEQRAAGVQLIYDGLKLTRDLANREPWRDDPADKGSNLSLLAADVMVSQGFAILSHTPAAEKAVETVRWFGKTQSPQTPARGQLEADILELAAIAGATGSGSPNEQFRQRAIALGDRFGVPLPPPDELLTVFHDRPRACLAEPRAEDQIFDDWLPAVESKPLKTIAKLSFECPVPG